jgi:hypothetical protein
MSRIVIDVRVRQHAYLRIASVSLDPGQITGLVGLDADDSKQMGSRSAGPPPVPRSNLWHLRSGAPDDENLDVHFDRLFARIEPLADGIRRVMKSEAAAWLTVVRYFEEGDEDFDEATYGINVPGMERLSGQHPFLGWGLAPDRLGLLARLGIGLDVDEYG